MKLVHWPLMGGLLHLVQGGGYWAGPHPAQAFPRCTKCNSPAHPSTASVPITVLLYVRCYAVLMCPLKGKSCCWMLQRAVRLLGHRLLERRRRRLDHWTMHLILLVVEMWVNSRNGNSHSRSFSVLDVGIPVESSYANNYISICLPSFTKYTVCSFTRI